jgi:adenine-specific DNA methylase
LRTSQPILVSLRIADGDETPAAPEIMAAMDVTKNNIKEALKAKPKLLTEVLACFEKIWEHQMEQKMYGTTLFLNLGNFFALREKDKRQTSRLRSMFNDVLWKMAVDDEEQSISKQADDYERSKGECFSKLGAIRDGERKNPSKFLLHLY